MVVTDKRFAGAAFDPSPGKTTGPRFDTLIVRGGPALESRMAFANGKILYDGSAASERQIQGNVTQRV